MGGHKQVKLNQLQRQLPEGLLVDASWLERHGYSRGLRSKYAASSWLEQVARGVYRRPSATLRLGEGEPLRWEHVVISLQTILGRPLIVGGRTALELQGFAHYLGAGEFKEVHLYGSAPPPPWVGKLKVGTKFVFRNAQRLFKNDSFAYIPNTLSAVSKLHSVAPGSSLVRQPWGHWDWPLVQSAPERAILELLDEVPQRETFHQADALMQGLSNLSPKRLQRLLSDCRSVKVRRLFLWFAERHNHAWVKQLDQKRIDLGQGKRMLAPGGKLDPKFNITVPEDLDGGR